MRLLAKTWFGLTEHERWAIMLVLGLFLLGLGMRAWHLNRERAPAQHPMELRDSNKHDVLGQAAPPLKSKTE